MKNNRLLFLTALVVLMGFQFSCKDMDYAYREFAERGETIYVSKADSIIVRGGNQRAEVEWLLLSDPKVTRYKMYWNNGRDSLEGTLQKSDEVDTIRVMVNNLAEGMHEFEIFLYDKYGNTSVRTSKIGRVYGERFQSGLYNRITRSMKRVNSRRDLEVIWLAADLDMKYSEIKYENVGGEEIVLRLKPEEEMQVLPDFALDGDFYVRTAYLPDSLALDTFYVDFQRVEVPPAGGEILLDKSLWKKPSITDEGEYYTVPRAAATGVEKVWDNKPDATGYLRMAEAAPLPNSFAIDLGGKFSLTKMKLHTLANNTNFAYKLGNPKKFEIYVSNTPIASLTGWTRLGEFDVVKPSGSAGNATSADLEFAQAGHDFTLPPTEEGYRYVRFRMVTPWGNGNTDTTIAELTFWGYEAD